MLEINIKY